MVYCSWWKQEWTRRLCLVDMEDKWLKGVQFGGYDRRLVVGLREVKADRVLMFV